MGDIVDELRSWPARPDGSDGMSSYTVGGIMEAAASEIERLRSELSALHDGTMVVLPRTRKHALDLITVADACLKPAKDW